MFNNRSCSGVLSTPPRKPKSGLSIQVTNSPADRIKHAITEIQIIEMIDSQFTTVFDVLRSIGASPIIQAPYDCHPDHVKKAVNWMMNVLTGDWMRETITSGDAAIMSTVAEPIFYYLETILNFETVVEIFLLSNQHINLLNIFMFYEFQLPILNIWWKIVSKLDDEFMEYWPSTKKITITTEAQESFWALDDRFYLIQNVQNYSSAMHEIEKLYIGHGNFSNVYKIFSSSCAVALKIPKSNYKNYEINFYNEVKVHSLLHHENIIKLHAVCLEVDNLSCVLEFASQGTLRKAIKNNSITMQLAMSFAFGIAKGLAYLHSLFIMHGDIKPDNILLDNDQIKISDFGCAADLNEIRSDRVQICGTNSYMAPEVLNGLFPYSLERDMYAYLKVFQEMLGVSSIISELNFFGVNNSQKENQNSNARTNRLGIPKNITRLILSCGLDMYSRPAAKTVASALKKQYNFK